MTPKNVWRHWRQWWYVKIFILKTMTWEDIEWRLGSAKTVSFRCFIFLLCWVIGTTVLLSGVQENQSEWLKWCLTKTYVFEWRLGEQILSRAGQVNFACRPSKVAMRVWNLTVETRVSSLVTQGHFGQIRLGCLVALNSPPPTTINGWLLRVKVRLLSFESNPPRSLWERIPCEDKALNTQSQRVLGITEVFLSAWPEDLLHLRTVNPPAD